MAQKLLDRADVRAALQEAGGETAAECMSGDPLVDSRLYCRRSHGLVDNAVTLSLSPFPEGAMISLRSWSMS